MTKKQQRIVYDTTCRSRLGMNVVGTIYPYKNISLPLHFTDTNECSSNGGLGPCEQICINTFLGHQCLCNPGHSLNDDGTSCTGQKFIQSNYLCFFFLMAQTT